MTTERKDEDGEGLNPSNLMMALLDVYVVQSGDGAQPFHTHRQPMRSDEKGGEGLNPYT